MLFRSGFASYGLASPEPPALSPIPVTLGEEAAVEVRMEGDSTILAPREKLGSLEVEIDQEEALSAPVEAGQVVGQMRVVSNGEVLAEIPLAAERSVARLTYWQLLLRCLKAAFLGG